MTVGTSVDGRTSATAVPNPVSHLKVHQERMFLERGSDLRIVWWCVMGVHTEAAR